MMIAKRLFTALFITVLSAMSLSAAAQSWEEGTHYKVIGDKATAKKEVLEVFSFWCPTCYRFEPIAEQIKQQLPKDAKFIKAHVNFMGYVDRDVQDAATKAMLAARAMKQEQELNTALFKAIHEQRQPITGMDDIVKVYGEAGGDTAKLQKLANSFGIRSQFNRNGKLVAGVSSVPTFIVNGKYQVTITRDMTPDDIVALTVWLTSQK